MKQFFIQFIDNNKHTANIEIANRFAEFYKARKGHDLNWRYNKLQSGYHIDIDEEDSVAPIKFLALFSVFNYVFNSCFDNTPIEIVITETTMFRETKCFSVYQPDYSKDDLNEYIVELEAEIYYKLKFRRTDLFDAETELAYLVENYEVDKKIAGFTDISVIIRSIIEFSNHLFAIEYRSRGGKSQLFKYVGKAHRLEKVIIDYYVDNVNNNDMIRLN